MSRFFVLFMVLGVNLVCSQHMPSISCDTQKLTKRIGDSVEFKCNLNYAENIPFLWTKFSRQMVDPVPLTVGDTAIIPNSRISLMHDYSSSKYSLKIDGIQETDEGTYRCELMVTPYRTIYADIELVVIRRPFIYDNSTSSVVALNGKTVKLECYAGGYPVPKVYWRRKNQQRLPTGKPFHTGNILEISDISGNDRGIYVCVAENNVDRRVRRLVPVTVLFAPVITVPKAKVGQFKHAEEKITCEVSSHPHSDIVWLKNGVEIDTDHHYSISQIFNGQDMDTVDATLSIVSVAESDYGAYTCKASNIYGTAEGTVVLYEV